MARKESNMIDLGTKAPAFELTDTVTGGAVSLPDNREYKATVVMFICNHCPYVKHVNPELVRIGNEYQQKGVRLIAISSNDVKNYPQDSPEHMKSVAEQLDYPFPYLYDETQEVAKAYDAACTPDFYVFDDSLELVYRGRLDASTPGNEEPLTGADLRAALDAVIRGEQPNEKQYPSVGCSIKWNS